MAITKRAGRRAKGEDKAPPPKRGGVKKATFDIAKKKEVGVSDLTLLSKVSDDAINDNLHKRFDNGIIYTYIGHVLISVNPFRDLGIYTDAVVDSYRGKNRLEVPPHVFAVAESMFYNMKAYEESQCVIISGESGAGKTEAAKRIMQYIAAVSGQSSSGIQKIKDMVLATNPLLESFGCAKTLRNDNSSRHGKYLEILFNKQAEPVGATITNYLLEKARVVGQIRDERNFHIFYQFTKGASQQQREMFGIQTPETYVYTSASKCTSVNSIDDVKDFAETLKAMETIGLGSAEQDQILKLLSAILWIGNIDFLEADDSSTTIRDSSVTNFVAYLLDVDAASLEKSLTIRVVETFLGGGGRRGSVYESPLNAVQARAVRDALAKGIYNNLFDWIVARVNKSLNTSSTADRSIGILDIYGFEIFEHNSFEQICINYVNEKLQQIFIELTLKTEQDEYVSEKIQWTPIKYFNNKIVCDLIEERRPPGVFSVLNDACATAHADSGAADQNFSMKMGMLSSNPHFQQRQNKFLIKHYAGDVMYDIPGMTDKNKDQMSKDLINLLATTQNAFLLELFTEQINVANEVSSGARRKAPTASDKIKLSANALTHTLEQSQPSYIRTIKPNQNRSPKEYDDKAVLHQVKYLGLNENVRIRRAGFAYRQTFEKFVERFYLLSGKTSYAGDYIWTGTQESATLQILKDASIPQSEYQMGVTKVFIKTPETLFALEHMRDMYWHNMAARIQRAWRRHIQYKVDAATKIQRAWREHKGSRKYTELRDKGHKILGGRKERRRFSLLGYRRFWGDYLSCNVAASPGGYLVSSCGIKDKVRFSARGEMLHAKFGRSSQRLPRIFILTQTRFYIVLESVLQNRLTYSVERTIAVSSIRSMNMSSLRDDWFAFNVVSSSEPDPLLWCVFKTELATLLNVPINIGATISYNKKPGKASNVKFQIDNTVQRDDFYKSGTVHVPAGMPANSVSEPVPKQKPRPVSSKPKSSSANRPVRTKRVPNPAPRAVPLPSGNTVPANPLHESKPSLTTSVNNAHSAAVSAAQAATGHARSASGGASHARSASGGVSHANGITSSPVAARPASKAAPPPPPPPAAAAEPAAPSQPMAKALYDFTGATPDQLSLTANEIVIVVEPETNGSGWFLAQRKDGSAEGWAPAAYVEQIKVAPKIAKKAPPAPPKRKPAPSAPQASSQTGGEAPNLASGLAAALQKKNDENHAFAGNLAQALKSRAAKMDSDGEEDDDW